MKRSSIRGKYEGFARGIPLDCYQAYSSPPAASTVDDDRVQRQVGMIGRRQEPIHSRITCSAPLIPSGSVISALTQWFVQLNPNRWPFVNVFPFSLSCLTASSNPGLESPGADQ